MRLLVWGANPSRAFPGDDCILSPTEVELDEGDELIWMGWASAIARRYDGSLYALTASGPQSLTNGQHAAQKVIGGDNGLAYLDTKGYIHVLPSLSPSYDTISQTTSSRGTSIARWADVAASETAIMGLTPDGRLFVFSSLDAIFTFDPTSSGDATAEATRYTEEIPLPPLPTATFRLYALETRLFVHVAGVGMQQLLELVRGEDDLGLGENQHGKGDSKGGRQYLTDSATGAVCGAEGPIAAEDARTRLVSIDIDALSFTIVSGAKNRLGILCDTGEAYLLDSRTRELEALSTGTRQGQPADDTRQASDRESGVKDVRPASPGLSDQAHDGGESDDEDQDEIIALGIGAGSEVLVSASGVWVRGENKFGQLGNGSTCDAATNTFARLPIDAASVSDVICSRWTTALILSPSHSTAK